MKRQTIWRLSVTTTPEAEEAVMELLTRKLAPHPSVYTDADTGVSTVSVFSTTRPGKAAHTRRLLRLGLDEIKACGLDIGRSSITIQRLAPQDWAESWKRHFPPLEIEEALLVKPGWSKKKARPGQSLVVLDPGLSFGTGQHPTTKFCLREIVRHRPTGQPASFLDLGTGSGILAISAAKLGYAPIQALDFDPQCVRVARANAARNRVGNKIAITRADLTQLAPVARRQYDVLCANLLADLLIAERNRILARLKPAGVLIVAGILNREFAEVAATYTSAGLSLAASQVDQEWRSGTFVNAAT